MGFDYVIAYNTTLLLCQQRLCYYAKTVSDNKNGEGDLPSPLLIKSIRLLLNAQNGVLGRLGHAELDHALGRNLDLLASRRVAADAGLPVHEDDFAQARKGERILGVLVGQIHDRLQGGGGLLFGEADGFRDGADDL